MNAPVRFQQTPRHRFTPDDTRIPRESGIVRSAAFELVDGLLVDRENNQPFRFTLDEAFRMVEIGRETAIAPLAFPELAIRPADLPVID